MVSFGLSCIVAICGATASADGPIVLENDRLLVELSAHDGSILRLRNKKSQLDLVSMAPRSRRPWALLLAPFELVSDFTEFQALRDDESPTRRVDLQWQTPHRITIRARASLAPASEGLELRCSAENAGDRTILAFRYPAIQGIGPLSEDGARDRLLHSTAMGVLFFDPFHLFQADGQPIQRRGMVVSRYPNGFHGSALQLMAYYAEGRGGFYVAAQDNLCTDKDLNFYKAPGGDLTCEIAHIQWDARPGKSLVIDYPVVIDPLTEGTWYEAAERYRAWAIQQPWCQRGARRERVDRADACRWLHEDIGAVGAWWQFRGDIREDVVRTRRLWGAPLLHLELWWRHGPSRDAAQSDGDRFGPFYFPFLAQKGKAAFAAHGSDQIVPPANPITPEWVAMCPAQPGWRTVCRESAADLAGTGPLRHHQIWIDENGAGCNADCLYHDIGPCAGVPTHCYSAGHVHAPGAGRDITRAYVATFEATRRDASQARGRYVPVGTECVTEPFVGCLDLYYARNSGFNPDMELAPYVRQLSWLPDGQMEAVPLFPFVYHEYGPVAIQGIYPVDPWGLSEGDDFFTWAEARTVLWGGLIVSFPLHASVVLPESRIRFLRSLAAARTGFARDFLAYGRMQRAPAIRCGTIEIDHGLAEGGWFRRIRFPRPTPEPKAEPPKPDGAASRGPDGLLVEEWVKDLLAIPATQAQSRTLRVRSVIGQSFTRGDDRLGIVLVNLRRDSEEPARISVDPVSCGLRAGTYEIWQIDEDGRKRCEEFRDHREIEMKLPSRRVVLLAATRKGD